MPDSDYKLESLKMVKEWCTWLTGLQAGICALLWPLLKESAPKDMPCKDILCKEILCKDILPLCKESVSQALPSWPSIFLYLGWFAFLFSLLFTVFLLSRLPSVIEKLDKTDMEKVFDESISKRMTVEYSLTAIYRLFILGALFLGAFIIARAIVTLIYGG